MSRSKGKRGEAEFERLYLVDSGLDFTREQDGRVQGGDFRIANVVSLDAKRRERIEIQKWSREIEAECPPHLTPAIGYRTNRDRWRVSMPADHFMRWLQLALRAKGDTDGS